MTEHSNQTPIYSAVPGQRRLWIMREAVEGGYTMLTMMTAGVASLVACRARAKANWGKRCANRIGNELNERRKGTRSAGRSERGHCARFEQIYSWREKRILVSVPSKTAGWIKSATREKETGCYLHAPDGYLHSRGSEMTSSVRALNALYLRQSESIHETEKPSYQVTDPWETIILSFGGCLRKLMMIS